MINLYRYLDYRVVIAKLVEEKRKEDPKFKQEDLAEATGIQKTYLSKVLNGVSHLNSDQLYEVLQYFKLDEEMSQYFFLLLELGRSANSKRKKDLQSKIAAIQLEKKNLKHQIQRKLLLPNTTGPELEYYLDPLAVIIHQFLMIRGFQEKPKLIVEKLGISESHLLKTLELLERANLAKKDLKTGRWNVTESNFHIPKESPLSGPRLHLLRTFAINHLMKIPLQKRFSYSSTIRADENTKNFIHEQILKLLKAIDPVIESAPEEAIYELNFDLFPWSLD